MSLPPNQPKVTPHTTIPPGGAGTTSHPPRVSGLLKKNLPLILGGTALLAGAYYIYRAGGDAKLAKTFSENDAAAISAHIKELPGKGKEVNTSAEETLRRIGSQVDMTVQEGKNRISEASQKLEEQTEEIKKPVLSTIDEMDKKVGKEASKAKSGISSWFGFGK